MPSPSRPTGGLTRWIPALRRLRSYQAPWLRADLVAGLTLAAYLLPAGIADASLANLPPEAGIYACLFPGLVFWLLCSSRHTAITVTSAISVLVGSSLGEMAGGDTARFGALAAGTALLVALIAFVAWLAKAGAIVNFISESVMLGFKCGVALFLASTQLPKLFGFKGGHGSFWERAGHFLSPPSRDQRRLPLRSSPDWVSSTKDRSDRNDKMGLLLRLSINKIGTDPLTCLNPRTEYHALRIVTAMHPLSSLT